MCNKDIAPRSTLLEATDGNLKVVSPNSETIDSYVVIPLDAFPATSDYYTSPGARPGFTRIDQGVLLPGRSSSLEIAIEVVSADFEKDRIKDAPFPEDVTHLALAENPIRIVAMKLCGSWHRAL